MTPEERLNTVTTLKKIVSSIPSSVVGLNASDLLGSTPVESTRECAPPARKRALLQQELEPNNFFNLFNNATPAATEIDEVKTYLESTETTERIMHF